MTRRLADQGKLGKRLEAKLRRMEREAGLRAPDDDAPSDLPASERVNRILAAGTIKDPRTGQAVHPAPRQGAYAGTVAAHFRSGASDD